MNQPEEPEAPSFTIDELVGCLEEAGFHVTYCRHQRPDGAIEGLGLFFAERAGGRNREAS